MNVSYNKTVFMKESEKLYRESELISKQLMDYIESDKDESIVTNGIEGKKLEHVLGYFKNNKNLNNLFSDYNLFSPVKGYQRFVASLESTPNKVTKRKLRGVVYIGIAASIAVILGVTVFLNMRTHSLKNSEIYPGISKATLILSDGERITASSEDFSCKKENLNIKYKKGSFSYGQNDSRDSIAVNKLVVPMGAETNITLSDGTRVWLNADSYLEHPAKFAGNTREVTVKGEAFFEVARDLAHPFIVHVEGQGDVQVLGTGFGITSYPDEITYITLAHGKIAYKKDKQKPIEIVPGEQLKISSENIFKRHVNVEEYIAWKDGKFVFRDKSLKEIMHTLERWYNVKIRFEDEGLQDLKFTGDVRRYDSINVLLDALKLTNEMDYSISGQTITLSIKK